MLTLGILAIAAMGCGDDVVDSRLDGGGTHDAALDAGREEAETTPKGDALAGYSFARHGDGGLRLTTPTGEVCYADVELGGASIVAARRSDGKVCIVVKESLVVDESECVPSDAGVTLFSPRGQACVRSVFDEHSTAVGSGAKH